MAGEDTSGVDAHTRANEKFSAYLEGELDATERGRLEGHLKDCGACRTELDRLRATVDKLNALRTKAPGTFLADVQNQIRTRSRGRFFGRRHLLFGRIPFEWVSLVMILAMLVYYIITQHGSPTDVAPGP
jgi:anti-sigma factor RsiW